MTARRNRAGQFAKVTPADQILAAACAEVIATVRFGIKVGRAIRLDALAKRLEVAAEEAAMLDGGAR